ncbi:M20 family metallopeptidase [Streptomyces sp. 142MFCol3.1]|uniref:M20 family metallopeptidase n=1 Tax=Streptomyces sp. 142MFCol3.1 TaxID=1172179 RepID=UPI00041F2925|nr:M20 family metallopeptidase [Streptomyces sp. 142MFCol3.1]
MTAPVRPDTLPHEMFSLAQARLTGYLRDLAELVAIDSGSYTPHGVNRVADWFQQRLDALGFTVERITPAPPDGTPVGDVLIARKRGSLPEARGGRTILLAGHMDTVFDEGTAHERPFTLEGNLAYGPGVSDDKGGLLAGLTALEVLAAHGTNDYAELVFLATPDEEIGSPGSRHITETAARTTHAALALECARENGDLVIARKGVADFRFTITGKAAHAGIEPERGANAALTAAHLALRLHDLNKRWTNTTVNIGVLRAGSRTNIVPDRAELLAEVRAATTANLNRITTALHELASQPHLPGTTIHVEQLDLCPPMEHTPPARDLLARAQNAAQSLGIRIGAAATGGVGDANIIAGTGVPVLDGLGPVGGADHTPEEWLDVSTVVSRVALLATLIATLGTSRS